VQTSEGYIKSPPTVGRIWERCAQTLGAPELVTIPNTPARVAKNGNTKSDRIRVAAGDEERRA
jgi:hypothetical protein